MLLRFVAKNFLSIAEEVELNLFPYTKLKTHKNHVYTTPQIDLLKVSAIYGANGAGKSNILKAVHYLHDIVVEGNIQHEMHPTTYFKLEDKYQKQATALEIEFKVEAHYYAYGVHVLHGEIVEEWLYALNIQKETDELVFKRVKTDEGKIQLEVADKYLSTTKEEILIQVYAEEILDHSMPFIHLVRKKVEQYPEIAQAFNWFYKQLYIIYPNSKFMDLVGKIIENDNFKDFVNDVLPQLDTGIKSIDIATNSLDSFLSAEDEFIKEEIKQAFDKGAKSMSLQPINDQSVVVVKEGEKLVVKRLTTTHHGTNTSQTPFHLNEESAGTRRLFDLLPILEMLINKECVCFIDELESSLHPILVKLFLQLFLNSPTKGQMLFTTHESHLLSLKLFRQDEIWFVEKNQLGQTSTYPLSEFKPRYDSDIRKGYLNGRFGGIPSINKLSKFL